jgi:MinD superfamily P-loop ATPase
MKIAIASGKGGTGKTFVSTNLFWVAQNKKITATLVDCDAEEPNVAEFISGSTFHSNIVLQHIPVIDTSKCIFCGKCYEFCNYNAIVCLSNNRFISVVEDLCHDCGACSVACKYDAITEKPKKIGVVKSMLINTNAKLIEGRADVGVYSPVPVIKKAIDEANNDSLIILDSPPGISCPFIATVEKADYVVLVTEPTPFGLNDLKLSVETLQQLGKPFGVVVNRAGLGNNDIYLWLKENNIPLLMEIPFDKNIARIYSDGKILAEQDITYQQLFYKLLETIQAKIR